MKKVSYLKAVSLLAAFLLFQIELIIAKILLPKFGGSYLVWGACVVFFQFMLFLGYLFSHLVIQRIGMFRCRYLYLVLVSLPLFFFPGRPLPDIQAHYGLPMVIDIFGQLLISVGLVFFVLSTASIISQGWLAASNLPEGRNPYVLYAVSNLGSFLAILTYPFLFESFFDLGVQVAIWRVGYLVLLGLHLMVFNSVSVARESTKEEDPKYNISEKEKIRWFLLAAAGSMLFLSVTNIITYGIAPVPLLWIIPLSIYLASFVLNFKERPFCPAWIKDKFYLTVGLSLLLFFLTQKMLLPFPLEIAGYLFSLFIISMFCQHELVRGRPERKRNLTIFYLVIASGSIMGSMLVSWVVPLMTSIVSSVMIEYPLSLFILSLALMVNVKRVPIGWYRLRLISYALVMLILWPYVFKGYNVFGLVLILLVFKFIYSELKASPGALAISLLAIMLLLPSLQHLWTPYRCIYAYRNYYGIYRICTGQWKVSLLNGTTLHGAQYLDPERKMEPLTYYHTSTPVGRVMEGKNFNFGHIGIVGLGAGTLAAYGKTGQTIDFFELDPKALDIANIGFSYLNKSQAKINYLFGDARLSLAKIPSSPYDILIVDAFSGDSIPIHLLTTEAIAEYKNRITKDGIILFHVTNNYLELVPVLFSNAAVSQAYACFSFNAKLEPGASYSVWVALTWSREHFGELTTQLEWKKEYADGPIKYIRPWTDKYSNTLSIFKLQHFLEAIKNFQPFYW